MMWLDVTDKVDFGNNDDEVLPVTKCICGTEFDAWDFIISIDKNDAYSCPNCGRKLFFTNRITVFAEATEDDLLELGKRG